MKPNEEPTKKLEEIHDQLKDVCLKYVFAEPEILILALANVVASTIFIANPGNTDFNAGSFTQCMLDALRDAATSPAGIKLTEYMNQAKTDAEAMAYILSKPRGQA